MLKKVACSTKGQLMPPTRNRWYESILLVGVAFALQRLRTPQKPADVKAS